MSRENVLPADMDPTQYLKLRLWQRYGAPDHPSEWDGRTHGGGKLSQRYWEYFQALELLELDRDAVVVDIGGGSPATGVGFLAELMALVARRVIIVDPEVRSASALPPNVTAITSYADHDTLVRLFRAEPEITHLACVSVFEHIEPGTRIGITRAINEAFPGGSFVTTFEYHARSVFFEHQLTARTTSELFAPLTRFYPDAFVASPVPAENGFDMERIFKFRRVPRLRRGQIPLWYPVATRFRRSPLES